ncbi:MAG: PIN domain-containing protein [Candidatus Accumulibacter sp.]|jgi:predicted nucleic acid-binding protein|nr:PIN domain-containing protein [Accumulibacter sp.]
MLLLVSDANILIDIDVGELNTPMFSLGNHGYQFAVPDVLFEQELKARHAYLLELGLQTRELSEVDVRAVFALSRKYAAPSRMDLFALALAKKESCPLLTGDAHLRIAAKAESVEVKGTLWLIREMLEKCLISVSIARLSLKKMAGNGRRLPWEEAEKIIKNFESRQG